MIISNKNKLDFETAMKRNIMTIDVFKYQNKYFKHEILSTSFSNPFLRFVEIDGVEIPANTRIPVGRDKKFYRIFTNQNIKNVRISYNHDEKILTIEEKENVLLSFNSETNFCTECFEKNSIFDFSKEFIRQNTVENWKVVKQINLSDIKKVKIIQIIRDTDITNVGSIECPAYKIIIKTK